MTPFDPIPGLPTIVPVRSPYPPSSGSITTVVPFTMRDGATYLQKLEAMHSFLTTLVDSVNYADAKQAALVTEQITRVIDTVNDVLATQDANVNEMIQLVVHSSITLQDPVLKAILSDVNSLSRVQLDKIIHDSVPGYINAEFTDDSSVAITKVNALINAAIAKIPAPPVPPDIKLPETELNVKSAPYNCKGDGVTNDTVGAKLALLHAMQKNKSVFFPAGTYMVSDLGIDYSGTDWPMQASSGAPFGLPGVIVRGEGRKLTIIQQIAGSTADLFTVKGKVGTQAGPANNNKVTGFSLRDLTLSGTSSGGNGLYWRSVVACSVVDVEIANCGKSGWYFARETFVSGQNDEYMYNLSGVRVRLNSNGRDGIEQSGTASIGLNLLDVEAIRNVRNGFKINPTNSNFIACQAIGNAANDAFAHGLWATRNTLSSSVNNALTLVGFRSEGNSKVDGAEITIDAGLAYSIIDPSFYPTTGAHCLEVGTKNVGPDSYVQSMNVLGGFFGVNLNTFPFQRALVCGSDSRNLKLDNPRFQFQNGTQTAEGMVAEYNSFNTSVLLNANIVFKASGALGFSRIIPQGAATPVSLGGTAQLFVHVNDAGKVELAIQMPGNAGPIPIVAQA